MSPLLFLVSSPFLLFFYSSSSSQRPHPQVYNQSLKTHRQVVSQRKRVCTVQLSLGRYFPVEFSLFSNSFFLFSLHLSYSSAQIIYHTETYTQKKNSEMKMKAEKKYIHVCIYFSYMSFVGWWDNVSSLKSLLFLIIRIFLILGYFLKDFLEKVVYLIYIYYFDVYIWNLATSGFVCDSTSLGAIKS